MVEKRPGDEVVVEHNLLKFGGGGVLMLGLGQKNYNIPGKGGF